MDIQYLERLQAVADVIEANHPNLNPRIEGGGASVPYVAVTHNGTDFGFGFDDVWYGCVITDDGDGDSVVIKTKHDAPVDAVAADIVATVISFNG